MSHAMLIATLSPLHRADGSAKYSSNGYSVIAAVNGPVEVQRRDELPEEAVVDVAIRPVSGVGGVRERYLESMVQRALRHVILVSAHPRTLIQMTLQIGANHDHDPGCGNLPQADSNLVVLPALLQASILALLSTSIPLSSTLTATTIAIDESDNTSTDPSPQELQTALSVHVLAFSSLGDLLIAESWGDFSIETWESVYEKALVICHGSEEDKSDQEDVSMDSKDDVQLNELLREAVQGKVAKEQSWKQSLG